MKKTQIPAIVWKEEKWFVARAVSLELASQGRSREEALKNLQEAMDLLLEDEGFKLSQKTFPQNIELAQIYA